jgi:RES domain-containing protein
VQLWRVSRHRDLAGTGGLFVSGRWHTQGHLVTYAAEHQGTAQLEWLAHLEVTPDGFPRTVPFSEIDAPDDVSQTELSDDDLPAGWKSDQHITQSRGDEWLDSGRAALLFVPSALVPARNVLLNPSHPDSRRIRIVRSFDYPLDPRLLLF